MISEGFLLVVLIFHVAREGVAAGGSFQGGEEGGGGKENVVFSCESTITSRDKFIGSSR